MLGLSASGRRRCLARPRAAAALTPRVVVVVHHDDRVVVVVHHDDRVVGGIPEGHPVRRPKGRGRKGHSVRGESAQDALIIPDCSKTNPNH